MTLASIVAAPLAGRLATRLGLRMTAAWGLTLVAAVTSALGGAEDSMPAWALPFWPCRSSFWDCQAA